VAEDRAPGETATLAEPTRIHVVGVGGAGMSAIAIILAAMGHRVSGADVTETSAWASLRAAGVELEVVPAHQLFASAAGPDASLVAHSTAFPPGPDDLADATAAGRTVVDRGGILAMICSARRTVAVSGTHGKTSTTAMLAGLLEEAGTHPSYLVGATPVTLGRAATWSSGDLFAVEADESDGTFLRLDAEVAVITNIDEDHLDHWGDIAAIEAAFGEFATQAPRAVVCIDDPRVDGLADPRAVAVAERSGAVTVGEHASARYRIHDVEVHRLTTAFGLEVDGREVGPVQIGTPGRHHARNAAVAVAAAVELGLTADDAVRAVAAYQGVARRFEVLGQVGGATVVDDYAHNPGKVRALLASAKEAGWRRVVVVFQPHRYTRTRDLVADFGSALALADAVAITEVYGAGEAPIPGVSGRSVVDAVLDAEPWADVAWLPTLHDAGAWMRSQARPDVLCLTVGAGDVSGLGRRLVEEAEG
jgi:UDP-N-acetylmuramate--alanine ligase